MDLTTHITDIANLLFYEDISDAVLVGHSYAGMVITGVASVAPERLKLLVYLDAYVPDEGQSEFDLWTPEMRAEIEADGAADRGLRPPPPPSLMGIDDPVLADWYQARVTPHPYATYTQPVPPGNPRSEAIPRAYISLHGRAADVDLRTFRGEGTTERLGGSHDRDRPRGGAHRAARGG